MGKAGKPTPSLVEKILHSRIQKTYGDSTPSVDQIVHSLREKYHEYRRHKLQSFTRMVTQTLDRNNRKGKRKDVDVNYDDDEDENTSPSLRSPMYKKAKKAQKSSSESESKSSSEEDRSGVSTDKDEEFDLMKSMLRSNYSGSKSKHLELEVVTNSNKKKVDLMNIDRTVGKTKNNLKESDGVDAKGKEDWPMFKDFGGMDDVLNDLLKRVIIPLYHPELPRCLGVRPTLGLLLHGPPGCGKTTLARAIANETGFPFYEVTGGQLVSGISGASEENIRELFSKAYRTAPSIVFIDEIDGIGLKRDNHQKEMERRIVTQLMTCMDQPHRKNVGGYVLVIGSTNRPDDLDPALRRPGRFDREIALGVPDENSRLHILQVLTRDLRLSGDIDLEKISRTTPGFVVGDLARLVDDAGNHAMVRILDERKLESEENEQDWWKKPWSVEEREKLGIRMLDFEVATKSVEASSKREGFSSIPDVKWEDVGGLDTLRREFDFHIVRRIKYPDVYKNYGIDMEMGFLLYGPPGCGKTLIAKALANEAGANFMHIKGPELLSKYVGESELAIRNIFSSARTCSPCILFFDEVDALTTARGKEGGWVVERFLNQLLVELDGADQRKGVYVIGASNRPEVIDRALLRPGRMGKLLYVPLPNQDDRVLILKALARKKPIDADVDLIAIGRSDACANLTGADLSALMHEAAVAAVKERFDKIEAATATDEPESCLGHTIKARHFEQVLGKISPSVSYKQKQYYHRLSQSLTAS